MAKIVGIHGMSQQEVVSELERGGRFIQYQWCFSVIAMTFKRGTNIYFIRAGESAVAKGLPWTILALMLGWWGIPWGPIWTVQSMWTNLRGGHDLSAETATALRLPIDKSSLYPEARKAVGAGK
ncbi:MAG TPA: hypothetical protein VFB79_04615 [Candidatus Angelobacter sp.]|nr:hypothetical protein [Candidatus Angelobacter sp.]